MANRRDGIRVKNLSSMHSFIPHLLPKRCDSEVYFNVKIDMTNLIKYLDELRKEDDYKHVTYFHLFCTSIAKIIYNRPQLNRFIINKKYYDRKDVSISFVAKRDFTEEAEESMQTIIIKKNDNIFTISDKINDSVKKIRTNKKHSVDKLMNFFAKSPKFVKSFITLLLRFGDKYDLLPLSITKDLPFYSSAFVANLGSIGCGALHHHLFEFGTNSFFITIGEIKDEVVAINGKPEVRKMCEFGLTIDERIGDGFHFVKILPLFEYMMKNPSSLEEDAGIIIDIPQKNN